jgi:hypothetical protein
MELKTERILYFLEAGAANAGWDITVISRLKY